MRFLIRDLKPGNYAVMMRSTDGESYSDWSRRFTLTVDYDLTAPNVPTNLSWVVSGDSFHGEWDAVTTRIDSQITKIDRYEIELVSGAATRYTSVVPQEAGGKVVFDLSFEQNRALFGTPKGSVSIRVRAVNSNKAVSAWTTQVNATNPAPGVPTAFVATAGIDQIELTWTPPADTDLFGYNVYTGTVGFTPAVANRIFTGNATRFTYRTTTYSAQQFVIRAVDKFGQESTPDVSQTATPIASFGADVTAPNTPTGLAATITTDESTPALRTSATVSWTYASPPADLAGYSVRYRQAGTTNWSTVNVGTDDVSNTTTVVIAGLIPYVNYEFQVASYDWSANYSAYSATVTATGATNTAPSTPTAPTVAANTLQIQVTVPGTKAAGGAMEADVVEYEVQVDTASGFTAPITVGKIAAGPAMVETFAIPATAASGANQTWYARIRAVDRGGLRSAYSTGTAGLVLLIANTNIADATITTAKITSLNVDKLTAGTGLIADITVKSKMTLGVSGGPVGAIESYDYSGGSAGFRLASDGLVIRTGSISAAALLIQSGANLYKAEYADFEYPTSFYTNILFPSQAGYVVDIGTGGGKFNTQYLRSRTTGTVASPLSHLGATATDYNITNLEVGKTYILSYYARNPLAGAISVGASMRWGNDGSVTQVVANTALTPSATAWTRYSGTFTVPAGATTSQLRFSTNATTTGVGFDVDGIQIEEKISASTTPSSWSSPALTTIDGGMIKTGSIQSNVTTQVNGVAVPVWSIPLNGAASFADLMVRGNTVLGTTADGAFSTISSANYIKNQRGWQIRADGNMDLLGLAAGSISVSALGGGDLDSNAIINLRGVMQAVGEMGEVVSMGADGFSVTGPTSERKITNVVISANVATITTDVDHNLAVGGKVLISNVGPLYDGVWFVETIPTTTTFTFTSTTASAASTGVNGNVVGKDARPDAPTLGKPYVEFPTDGTKPNIISGFTTSENLTVERNAIFKSTANIATSASMTLDSYVNSPTSPPNVSNYYPTTTLTLPPSVYAGYTSPRSLTGICDILGSSNFLAMSFAQSGTTIRVAGEDWTANIIYISEFTANGTFVADRYVSAPTTDVPARGFVRATVGANMFYYAQMLGTNTNNFYIQPYNAATWTAGTKFSLNSNMLLTSGAVAALGADYTSSPRRLMILFTNPNTGAFWIRYHNINQTTGDVASEVTPDVSYASATTGTDPTFIMRHTFPANTLGYNGSVDRIIAKDGVYGVNINQRNYMATDSTGARVINDYWPSAYNADVLLAWYRFSDDSFHDVNKSNSFPNPDMSNSYTIRDYQNGDAVDPTIVTRDHNHQFGYTWYATPEALETKISPLYTGPVPKRAQVVVTIPKIPLSNTGVANTPTDARIYYARETTTSGVYGTYRRPITISGQLTSGIVSRATVIAGTPPGTNAFTSVGVIPGRIQNSANTSWWDGTGDAAFRNLTINGTTGLTLGPKAAAKWNFGGPTTVTLDSSGQAQVPHGLGITPAYVDAIGWNLANTRIVQIWSKDSTNFTIQVKNDSNVNVTGSFDIMWFAIG